MYNSLINLSILIYKNKLLLVNQKYKKNFIKFLVYKINWWLLIYLIVL